MIVIRLSSGLGNQLFMYAFFKYIEHKYGEQPFFDDKYFKDHRGIIRNSEISVICPNYPIHKFMFNPAGERRLKGYIYRWKQALFPSFNYVEDTNYDDSMYYTGNVYFNGYWQTDKYVKTLDLHLFEPKESMPRSLEAVFLQINNVECPVSIHFRRGDYFMPKWIGRYGVCTVQYYIDAIAKLKNMLHLKPTFFIFSDDLEWVRQNIIIEDNHVFVPNLEINSFWYIYLMSKCKHHIISNSTFSWWGAYLNSHIDKIVIGPSKWMLDTDETLMLPEWEKITIR